MKWSLFVGKYFGIKVKIHWTFLILIGWIVVSELNRGSDWSQVGLTVLFVLSIFLCVLLHEFGHALTAQKYNIATTKITLLPIGGLASLERIPDNPKHELWITAAGPAVNVVIALILYLILPFDIEAYQQFAMDGIFTPRYFIYSLFAVNVILVVFNLIPAFPMDGGRILRALLAFKLGRIKATSIASSIGQFIAVIFTILGLFYNPFLLFIGFFVFLGAYAENITVQNLEFLKGYRVKDAMMTKFGLLKPEQTINDALNAMLSGTDHDFIIATDNEEVIGSLSRKQLLASLKDHLPQDKLSDIMNKDFFAVNESDRLDQLFTMIQRNGETLIPVVKNGKLVGAINMENINEFIMIQSALHY
ncbi:MAG TPA: site-2 protease family protein [Cytophagaceae bacterium]